ncbi:thioredoxin domain-containing protein 15-like isoform X2 [Anneissia japonica]|uniref:thioredoxin domain-containing protein 15-like isoform X2 n=1 Tax=Anneissia japonica TaxID=1529436 RepID=UPI0014257C85|nr:thioredoxin domain-containing protein 15-like isoform X2 [Anneissia japonica]
MVIGWCPTTSFRFMGCSRNMIAAETDFEPEVGNTSLPILKQNDFSTYNKEEHFMHMLINVSNSGTQNDNNGNTTTEFNKTDVRKVKYPCIAKQTPDDLTAAVKILNTTQLLEIVSVTNATNTSCAFVMFYAPWCKFSAETAPYLNAIGRAFPGLDVLAVDAMEFNNLNARYGTVAVPNVLLFYKGKPVMRFNYTRTFENFRDFIQNNTGLQPDSSVEVLTQDYDGPLPSIPTKEPDYILWLSVAFLALFTIYMMYQHCGHIVARLHQEMVGDVHEHID